MPEVANPGSKDSERKRACTTQQQEGPPKKTSRRQSHQHALKEICSDQITRTAVHLGSGSYGSCHLALYKGLSVVVKELRVKQLQRESREEAETIIVSLIFQNQSNDSAETKKTIKFKSTTLKGFHFC